MFSPAEYPSPWESWLQKYFYWLLIPALLVNASALFVTILEPDGALYANIAAAMARTGDFIHLKVEGRDWLDKPHFPFWIAALSDRLFGIGSFAYKFPALLFWGMGGWYTYRLAAALYTLSIARLSVLIYCSAAHLVISNNDVRAEPYLTGLVIGSVFHFYRASKEGAWIGRHLVSGCLLAACAVMTKGPFVLITIGGGFIIDWMLKKQFGQLLHPRWWIALALTGLFILPELYCLYVQFDLHPEKIVFRRTGVSGIRFFFWDSQFGRFFNTGPIKGSGDPFFYFHTLLWAFLPWSLLLYAAVIERVGSWGKGLRTHAVSRRGSLECITSGAAGISFLIFSLSRFQLPHYLNILFPFFSILTAGWLYTVHGRFAIKAITLSQNVIVWLLALGLIALSWLYHFPYYMLVIGVLVLLTVLAFILFRGGGGDIRAAFGRSLFMALVAYLFIDTVFYPAMLGYQSGSEAARYINRLPGEEPVYIAGRDRDLFSFESYLERPLQRMEADSLPVFTARRPGNSFLVFMPVELEEDWRREGCFVQELRRFPQFHISRLTGEFIYYKTRARTLRWYAVVRMGGLQQGPRVR